VLVTVADPPALTLSGDSTICGGSQAEVTASGAALYLWSAAGITLDCPTCATQKLSPAVTTILHVEGRSIEGCITVDSFRVAVVEVAEISVSGEGPICSGGSRQLHATGATSYRWEPADGLSCSDCADPVAGPGTTTTYRVIGSFPGGCADTVSVKVTVGDESRVIASLPRDLHLSIGASGRLTLRLDREITADTLELELAWRRGVIGLDRVALVDAVKADGWSIEVIGESEQSYHARLIRSTPALLREGDILSLEVRGYLGDSAATELPFTLTANSACTVIEPRPGRVTIDSICGLNIRLITAAKGMLRLDAPSPHPIIGQGVIRYAIPFDAGDVELRMIDPAGHVRLLGGGYHAAGEYEITLDARDIAPGVYLVHLRVGDLVRQMEVVVLR
jgi:hypothetical protein